MSQAGSSTSTVQGKPASRKSPDYRPTLSEALNRLQEIEGPCSHCGSPSGEGYTACVGSKPGERDCRNCVSLRLRNCSKGKLADAGVISQFRHSYPSGKLTRPVESKADADYREKLARPCQNCAAEEERTGVVCRCRNWEPGAADCERCVEYEKDRQHQERQLFSRKERRLRDLITPPHVLPQCSKGKNVGDHNLKAHFDYECLLTERGLEGLIKTKILSRVANQTDTARMKTWGELYGTPRILGHASANEPEGEMVLPDNLYGFDKAEITRDLQNNRPPFMKYETRLLINDYGKYVAENDFFASQLQNASSQGQRRP